MSRESGKYATDLLVEFACRNLQLIVFKDSTTNVLLINMFIIINMIVEWIDTSFHNAPPVAVGEYVAGKW